VLDGSPRGFPPPRSTRLLVVLCFGLAVWLLVSAVPAFAAEKPETPLTESCSGPIKSGAQQLCGTLNPHSSAKVGSYFAYDAGTSCAGGSRTLARGEVEGEEIEVSGEATGLQAGTEYTYCLVATNSAGETFGQPVSFTTPPTESAQMPQTPITAPCTLLCAGVNTDPPLGAGPLSLFSTSTSPKPLTRAQNLARALRICHKKAKHRRAACEKRAHIRYGTVRKAYPAGSSATGGKQK
jgi:hypothetical protein